MQLYIPQITGMKFGQLIHYKIIKFFLEKSYTRCSWKSITRPSFKKFKIECINLKYISSYQDFPKIKKGSGSNLPALFSTLFLEKSFSLIIYHYLKTFILLLPLLGNRFIVIVSQPCCEIVDFEIDLIFLFKTFFLHDQNVKTKIWISWQWKELFRWNKKRFHLF